MKPTEALLEDEEEAQANWQYRDFEPSSLEKIEYEGFSIQPSFRDRTETIYMNSNDSD